MVRIELWITQQHGRAWSYSSGCLALDSAWNVQIHQAKLLHSDRHLPLYIECKPKRNCHAHWFLVPTQQPRTMFSKGVMSGHLMGHEMSGMMLVLAATLQTTRGRNLILTTARGQQKQFFANQKFVRDWSMLIETQLQFECWLLMPAIQVQSAKRAQNKVKEVMMMGKQIGKQKTKA